MWNSNQMEEIKTIRERNVVIKLSDADVKRIADRAGAAGLTVAELLESFIGDLVCGTYNNGSDEREFADNWFERCGFSFMNDGTFLQYFIDYNQAEDIATDWEELQYRKENNESDDGDKVFEDDVNEAFADYVERLKRRGKEIPTFEDEMKLVMKWYEEYKSLTEIC